MRYHTITMVVVHFISSPKKKKKRGFLSSIKHPSHSTSHADFGSSPHSHLTTRIFIQWPAQLLSLSPLPHPLPPPTTTVTSDLGKSQSNTLTLSPSLYCNLPPLSPRHSLSPSRRFERRLIRLWKRMTRRNERASILPDGFVLMNEAAARRRSLCMAPAKLKRSRPAHLAP